MSQTFDVRLPLEESYQRHVLFGLELLDAVTLSRVSQGVKVVADGLQGRPIVNSSGLFVWLKEDFGRLRKISINPGVLPYEKYDLPASEVKRPLTTVQLQPRSDYAFTPGITGLRGTLIEERVNPPELAKPVRNAEVQLQWLDVDDHWQDSPTISRTDVNRGDFVSILRLASTEIPQIKNGKVTVRLRARRDEGNERSSAIFELLQGRVTDPSTLNTLTFAWDEFES